jgi:tRNA pseudouridine38/39 synthase
MCCVHTVMRAMLTPKMSLLASVAAALEAIPPPSARGFDLSRFRYRHVALHIAYQGHEFFGFASQEAGGGDAGPGFPGAHSTAAASRKRARVVAADGGGGGGDAPAPAPLHPSSLLTIETLLFGALRKACLVESRDAAGYNRCGRTDKGVSAGGQVVSLRLRSRAARRDPPPGWRGEGAPYSSASCGWGVVPAGDGGGDSGGPVASVPPSPQPLCAWMRADGLPNTGDAFPPPACEHDYALTLNNILPPQIRVLGWSDVPDAFSARFSTTLRAYRYYFPVRALDVAAMRDAGQALVGAHDFRNVCKVDLSNTQNFVREVLSFRVVADGRDGEAARPVAARDFSPAGRAAAGAADAAAFSGGGGRGVAYFEVVGRAFLWHQIRCVAALMFLVGRGLESRASVVALLDVDRVPARPAYAMASEAPLVLHECSYAEDGAPAVGWRGGRGGEEDGGEGGGAAAEGGKPSRYLPHYAPANVGGTGFHASAEALRRLTLELEAQWSELTVRAALVKGMLETVRAIPVSAAALEAVVAPVAPGRAPPAPAGERPPAASAEPAQPWGALADAAPALLDVEDCEYPVGLRGPRACVGKLTGSGRAAQLAALTPADRGYTPLLQRAVATTVEARWAGLPEGERAAILAKHPVNAPRLQAAADAAAAAAAAGGGEV